MGGSRLPAVLAFYRGFGENYNIIMRNWRFLVMATELCADYGTMESWVNFY
jgi:hypothetical protein